MTKRMHPAAVLLTACLTITAGNAGVILHYDMESGNVSDTSIADQSGVPVNNAIEGGYGVFIREEDSDKGSVLFLPDGLPNKGIVVDDANGLTAADEFTISGWYKGDDSDGYFFDQESPRLVIGEQSDNIQVYFKKDDSGGWLDSGLSWPNDGLWHHIAIACTNNATDAVFIPYLDGVAGTTVTATDEGMPSLVVQADRQRFGSKYNGSANHLEGRYDDLRVHDTALSAAEVASLHAGDQTDMVLHLTWETGYHSGSAVDDQSVSAVRYTVDDGGEPVASDAERGHVIDITSDRIYINPTDLDTGTNFTIATWFKGGVGKGYIFDQNGSPRVVCWIGNSANDYVGIYDGASFHDSAVENSEVADSTWHHLAWVFSDNGAVAQFTLYVDGVNRGTVTGLPHGLELSGGNVQTFARSASGSNYQDGRYDEIRVYDKALSDGEVLVLYEETLPEEGTWEIALAAMPTPVERFRCTGSEGDYVVSSWSGSNIAQGDGDYHGYLPLSSASGYEGFPSDNTHRTVASAGQRDWRVGLPGMGLSNGTIVTWINPAFDGPDSTQCYLYLSTTGGGGHIKEDKVLSFYLNNSGLLGVSVDETFVQLSSQLDKTTDKWYMVAATWDQSTPLLTLYLDGESIGTATTAWDDTGEFDERLVLGKESTGNSRDYVGAMDELIFWDSVLTADQIEHLYARGVRGPAKGTTVIIR